jgi:4-hydroxyphenylacetate 3-monooxygenase/chlorophenol-4-monooxygenase component 2
MEQTATNDLRTGKLREVLDDGREPHLLTGEQYKQSLRDGRRIFDADGEQVADVTAHPHLRATVDTLGRVMDLQHDPAHQDVMTYVDPETRTRRAIGWQVPTEKEHLYAKRAAIKQVTRETLGMYGRPPDYGPAMALGFLGIIDRVEAESHEFAENIRGFVKMSGELNALSTDLILDAQSDRTVPRNDRPGTLRVVDETSDGVVLRGSKVAGSMGSLTHFFTLSTVLGKGLSEDAAIWAAIPVSSPGLSLVMREPTIRHGASRDDHPVDANGEEIDQIMLFEDVFLPREYVFSLRNLQLLTLYHESCAYALWHIMTRLSYRAEIFAGTAQAIADVLGTTDIPGVRNAIAQVTMYSQTLRAYSLASIERAVEWCGVQVPNPGMVAAGRLYSITEYPKIMYLIQDMCGQGLVSRWPEKVWDHPEIGPRLEAYLPGAGGVTARDKNRLFNFVFDLTTGGQAGRVGLFENVNATPPAFVAELVYQHVDRSEGLKLVHQAAGLRSPS